MAKKRNRLKTFLDVDRPDSHPKSPQNADVSECPRWELPPWQATAVFFLSLTMRFLYLAEIRRVPLLGNPILDSAFYDLWAQEIVRGDWLSRSKPIFALSPAYAYWLALQYLAVGRDFVVTASAQFFLGAFTAVIVFFIARHLVRSKIIAFLGAAAYALYGPALCYEAMPITAAWINLLNSAALLLLIRSSENVRPSRYGIAGFLIGLSSQFRPTVLLFPVLAIPLLFWLYRNNPRFGLRLASRFLLGLAIPLALFIARNCVVTGKARITVSSGSMNFFIGNSKYSNGTYLNFKDIESGNPSTQFDDYRRKAGSILGRELTVDESNAFWRQEAVRYIREHPKEWLRLESRKLALWLGAYEIGNNLSYYYFLEQSRILRASSFLTMPIFVLFAALGICHCLADSTEADKGALAIIGAYCASYIVVGLLFFVVGEYRFALIPALLGFAACGIRAISSWVRSYSWRRLGWAGIGLILASIAAHVNSKWLMSQDFKSRELAVAYSAAGDALRKQGDVPAAIANLERALVLDPSSALAPIKLSTIFMAQGRYDAAAPILKRALSYNNKMWQIYANLGICSFRTNNLKEAESYSRTAAELNPSPENQQRYFLLRRMVNGAR